MSPALPEASEELSPWNLRQKACVWSSIITVLLTGQKKCRRKFRKTADRQRYVSGTWHHGACEAAVREIVKEFGSIDILVNNAGITKDGLLMAMSEENFDSVIDVNLKGTFNMMRFVSRQMLKQRSGRIISMASVVGIAGNAGQANYAASKAGVIGLTKSAARELASRGITVNAVAPGFIETEMTAVLPEKVKEASVAQIPLGHFENRRISRKQ